LYGLNVFEGEFFGKAKKVSVMGAFPTRCEYILFKDSLFVCGGQNSDNSFRAETYLILIGQPPLKAEQKENMPIGRTGHCLLQVEDSVYAIGGTTIDLLESVDIYSGGSWKSGPALMEPLKEPAGVYIKEAKTIYVFGGRAVSGFTATVSYLKIDTEGSEWTVVKDLPISLQDQIYMYMAVPYKQGVMLFGGFVDQACYYFDLNSQEVERIPDLLFPDRNRVKTSTIYPIGDSIYAFGTTDGQLYALGKGKWAATSSIVWCGESFSPEVTSAPVSQSS
jgi:hypothetical protein